MCFPVYYDLTDSPAYSWRLLDSMSAESINKYEIGNDRVRTNYSILVKSVELVIASPCTLNLYNKCTGFMGGLIFNNWRSDFRMVLAAYLKIFKCRHTKCNLGPNDILKYRVVNLKFIFINVQMLHNKNTIEVIRYHRSSYFQYVISVGI